MNQRAIEREKKKKYLARGRGDKNQWQTCSGLEMGPNSVVYKFNRSAKDRAC